MISEECPPRSVSSLRMTGQQVAQVVQEEIHRVDEAIIEGWAFHHSITFFSSLPTTEIEEAGNQSQQLDNKVYQGVPYDTPVRGKMWWLYERLVYTHTAVQWKL